MLYTDPNQRWEPHKKILKYWKLESFLNSARVLGEHQLCFMCCSSYVEAASKSWFGRPSSVRRVSNQLEAIIHIHHSKIQILVQMAICRKHPYLMIESLVSYKFTKTKPNNVHCSVFLADLTHLMRLRKRIREYFSPPITKAQWGGSFEFPKGASSSEELAPSFLQSGSVFK